MNKEMCLYFDGTKYINPIRGCSYRAADRTCKVQGQCGKVNAPDKPDYGLQPMSKARL
jgi:hypothetical protein